MDVSIREGVAADAPRIHEVHLTSIKGLAGQSYDDDQIAAWAHERDPAEYPIESPDTYFLVAERNDRMLGFGWMKPEADDYFQTTVGGEITATYVHPSVARRGIGSRIYDELEAYARRRSIESLGLWASLNAVPFYEAKGYERMTDHTYEFHDGIEGTVAEMRKSLTR